jgi:hypothetical protein
MRACGVDYCKAWLEESQTGTTCNRPSSLYRDIETTLLKPPPLPHGLQRLPHLINSFFISLYRFFSSMQLHIPHNIEAFFTLEGRI